MRRSSWMVVSLLVVTTCAALAEEAALAPQTASVTVKVVNGTTSKPGTAERVELREVGYAMKLLAEADAVTDQTIFPAVPLQNFHRYLAVAVKAGVEYRAALDGQKIIDGQPLTVYVFDETTDHDGVRVSGMNVMARRKGAGFELQYVLTVVNDTRPQKTVTAASLPVQVLMPSGTVNLQGEYYRGPESEKAELRTAADGFTGAAVALTPGSTRFSVLGFWPVSGRGHLDVACNLPVQAWSLLVAPRDLVVTSAELEPDASGDYPEFNRLRGPALTAGQRVPVDVSAPTSTAEASNVFPSVPTVPGGSTGTDGDREGGGFPWAIVLGASVLLVAFGIWRRGR